MSPDLALLSTLTGSNYPCLELIFTVPKVLEPSKFDCMYLCLSLVIRLDFLDCLGRGNPFCSKISYADLNIWGYS